MCFFIFLYEKKLKKMEEERPDALEMAEKKIEKRRKIKPLFGNLLQHNSAIAFFSWQGSSLPPLFHTLPLILLQPSRVQPIQ